MGTTIHHHVKTRTAPRQVSGDDKLTSLLKPHFVKASEYIRDMDILLLSIEPEKRRKSIPGEVRHNLANILALKDILGDKSSDQQKVGVYLDSLALIVMRMESLRLRKFLNDAGHIPDEAFEIAHNIEGDLRNAYPEHNPEFSRLH